MQESWREAEDWHCERPEEAIGEGTALEALESPGLKRLYREVEAWYHEQSL